MRPITVPTYMSPSRGQPKYESSREMQVNPEMRKVLEVVGELQKDVAALRGTSHLSGAQRFAEKRGKGWSAHEADIIGDERPEVFITDPRGYLRVINGFSTRNTRFTTRQMQGMKRDSLIAAGMTPKEASKLSSHSAVRSNVFGIVPRDGELVFDYENNVPAEFRPQARKMIGDRKPSAFRAFQQSFTKIFGVIADGHDVIHNMPRTERMRLHQKVLSNTFNQMIAIPVLTELGNNVQIMTNEEFKQLKNRKVFKNRALTMVYNLLDAFWNQRDNQTINIFIDNILHNIATLLNLTLSEEDIATEILNTRNTIFPMNIIQPIASTNLTNYTTDGSIPQPPPDDDIEQF
jgi:hypothetical protein